MIRRVSISASTFVYILNAAVFALLLYAFADFFRSTPIALAIGGFFGSVFFFFAVVSVVSVGRRYSRPCDNSRALIFAAALVALLICLLIDRHCALFCLLYCVPVTVYLVRAAEAQPTAPRTAAPRAETEANPD